MHRSSRFVFAFAVASAALLVAGAASAQTTGTATVALNPGQPVPNRYINGALQNPRPVNLNPTGVNYSDCIENMTLQFSVLVSGFGITSTQNLQVWATRTGDCTAPTTRGIGSPTNTCWLVNGGQASLVQTSTQAYQFNVRVQDLVGPQNAPPLGTNLVHENVSACTQQQSFAAVSMDIWFLPLDTSGNVSGTAFDYSINTDLVGPPAPVGPTINFGDTLLNVSWTPNTDSDTAGYDLFIDPIPGGAASSSPVCTNTGTANGPTTVASTTDASDGDLAAAAIDAPIEAVAEAAPDDAAGDALTDAPMDAVAEAAESDAAAAPTATSVDACVPVNHGGLGAGGVSCGSTILAGGFVQDSGTVTVTQTVDEAGDIIDGGSVVSGVGGISTIPVANLVGMNSGSGETVSDKSVSSYTITGLMNGQSHHYNVVISAVDGSGNIGPPSSQVCDYPAPVNDFWKLYKEAGGQAGGSFCALEVIGQPMGLPIVALTFGAAAFATARRRRKDRR